MLHRLLESSLASALRDTPCVVVHGPRQAGKTTLVRDLLPKGRWAGRYLTLDDASVLSAASADPEGFVAALRGPVVLDEAQRAPGLPLALKASIDRDRRPGRFILTGSTDVLALPRLSEALAGRVEILTLWPLAQAELECVPGRFVDDVLAGRSPSATTCTLDNIVTRLVGGGYPEPLARPTPARRRAWFESYITTVMQRDVRHLANVQGLAELPRLLGLVAARTAGLLNRTDLARDAGLAPTTLERYLALLQATFLVGLLPAWHSNRGKRLVKSPKLMLMDPGLATHLLGVDRAGLLASSTMLGALLETFVTTELVRLAAVSEARPRVLHFRAHGGAEVDIVLEDQAGRIVGIEVKAGQTVKADHFRGLGALRDLAGDRFVQGVLLHTGTQSVPFGDRLSSVPLSALWSDGGRRR